MDGIRKDRGMGEASRARNGGDVKVVLKGDGEKYSGQHVFSKDKPTAVPADLAARLIEQGGFEEAKS